MAELKREFGFIAHGAIDTAWQKFGAPIPPAPLPLSLAGVGALAINLTCAYMLARFRHATVSLTRAAFLSARNDAVANVAIIGCEDREGFAG